MMICSAGEPNGSRGFRASDLLIVVHVPKTAGTTFRAVLKRNVPKSLLFEGYSSESLSELDRMPNRDELRVFVGHLPFGMHERFDRNCRYYSFVREPIHQVLSHYNHFLNSTDAFHRRVLAEAPSLEQFASHPLAVNLQTQFLSGLHGREPRVPVEEALELAKRNIAERFVGVGVTERFDESLLLLARRMNWKHLIYIPENTSEQRPKRIHLRDVPPETIARIRDNNRGDQALYEHAQRLLEDEMRATPQFRLKLACFRVVNRAARPLLSMRPWLGSLRQKGKRWLGPASRPCS